jgi:hypothetical protein
MLTVLMGATGTAGYGFWVFLVVVLVGVAAVATWAWTRLRASGYFEPPADVTKLYPAVPERQRARRAA